MENVFAAVADSTRRRILEQLRSLGPLSIQELAAPLPMSRQAVTKHLKILLESGLVETRWAGRKRIHSLVAQPLREVEQWLRPYAEFWDDRLERLTQHLTRPKEKR